MIRIMPALAMALAFAPAVAGEGSAEFVGLSGHAASGSVDVTPTDSGWEIRLGPDFRFDGAPDPRIGFGTNGRFAAGTDFEPLRANAGEQVYSVPDSIDLDAYDEIYIWCREYAVPLARAELPD